MIVMTMMMPTTMPGGSLTRLHLCTIYSLMRSVMLALHDYSCVMCDGYDWR